MHKKLSLISLAFFSIACCMEQSIQEDGTLISSEKFTVHRWEELGEYDRQMFDKETYEKACKPYQEDTRIDWQKILYWSDGLKVVGFIIKDSKFDLTKKYPVIIFNRGGSGEFGKIKGGPLNLKFFTQCYQHGYIVFAPQLRGIDGGEGKEEFGGNEIHDILNIIKVASSLAYTDINNVFILGTSTGSMRSFVTLKENPPINAVVVESILSDLFNWKKFDPQVEELVYKEYIPHYEDNQQEELEKRSAVFWPEKLSTVPLLLIHGGEDERTPLNQATKLLKKIESYKNAQLILYCGGGHMLSDPPVREDIFNQVFSFFQKHKKQP